ncbi:MAG: DUF1307 domain-containing protein [Erysipelotrichales bacterium]|nr:DUF1307 domain-containing protein [Erysipelotrichales bacterium]
MKKIILILFICLLLPGCSSNINSFDTKMVCRLDFNENIDDYIYESTSNIYIDYDKQEYVTKAIYQSISDLANYNDYYLESLDSIINEYKEIEGISGEYYIVDDKLVLEITYEYEKLDLSEFRKFMGDLLDEESILGIVDELPIKLSEFESIELEGYECEVK